MDDRKDWGMWKENSEKKVREHIPSVFSIPTKSSLRSMGNNYGVYRGKDCMKKFCEYFKKMKSLTKEQ